MMKARDWLRMNDEHWPPYEVLWSRVGGRPWTHIIRDTQVKHPLAWLLGFLLGGCFLGHLFW